MLNCAISTMQTFLSTARDVAQQRGGAPRLELLEKAAVLGLPTTQEEVWRYTPISRLRLDDVVLDADATTNPSSSVQAILASVGTQRIDVMNGVPTWSDIDSRIEVSAVSNGIDATRYDEDFFGLLNSALTPATLSIGVNAETTVDHPLVIVHHLGSNLSFPQTVVHVGQRSSLEIIEVWLGADDGVVVPLSEYVLDDGARLRHVAYQRLADSAWNLSRTTAFLGRDAEMYQSVFSMGGRYDRARNDAILRGTGAYNELGTTFLGRGDQIHDLRSHQFHEVGRTRSQLLSKGAAAGTSRSVYTGLIEIERGARRSDARQSNFNLLLSPSAHADSVPNLDIRENDVACSHASSVGPLDELQRWYLESRGVERSDAERLMIQGFFNEMLEGLPDGLARAIESDVATLLAEVVS